MTIWLRNIAFHSRGPSRLLGLASLFTLLAAGSAPVLAQRSAPVSPQAVRRAGLERAWQTRVQTGVDGEIVRITTHVSPKRNFTAYEVTDARGAQSYFTERDAGSFGETIGLEEAGRLAELKVAELRARGLEPKLETKTVPYVALYAQTTDGNLHAIDGENGATIWSVQVGVPFYPSYSAAVTETHVAAINGSYLYILERATGRILRRRQIGGVPGAGASIFAGMVYVPTISGLIEVYEVESDAPMAYSIGSAGQILTPLTISPASMSWATNRGMVYVGRPGLPGVDYRLSTRDTITSATTQLSPYLFATSLDGFLYAINEADGKLLWQFSAGDAISQAAVAVDDAVYLVDDSGQMFCVEAETGVHRWAVRGIQQIVSVSDSRVYCLARDGQLVVIDRTSGGRTAQVPMGVTQFAVTNTQTDRLYVGSKRGSIQCLREIGRRWPLARIRPEEPPEESKEGDEAAPAEEPGQPPPSAAPAERPADEEANPFLTEDAEPAAPEAAADEDLVDPFGFGDEEEPAGDADAANGDDFGLPF